MRIRSGLVAVSKATAIMTSLYILPALWVVGGKLGRHQEPERVGGEKGPSNGGTEDGGGEAWIPVGETARPTRP